MALLDIRGLTVRFATRRGAFAAVDGIDIAVDANEVLAIVGESGSGKSVAMLAVMGLLPWTATVSAERIDFDGRDLRTLTPAQRRALIGRDIAMVFQEPMSCGRGRSMLAGCRGCRSRVRWRPAAGRP